MRIKTLEQVKRYTSNTYFREKNITHKKKIDLYICQPKYDRTKGWYNLYIWKGNINFYTNSKFHKIGMYYFVIDKTDSIYKERLIEWRNKMKETRFYKYIEDKITMPICIDLSLYYIQSEGNCKLYSHLKPITDYMSNTTKAIFTTKAEAEQYIRDLEHGNIVLLK